MRTTADENKDAAISSMEDAIKYLSEIVINKCYGYDEYYKEYLILLKNTMFDLINLKDDVNNWEATENIMKSEI